jgi:hypothetical protein
MVNRLSLVLLESERFYFIFNFEHVHLKSRHFFIYLFYCYNSGEDLDRLRRQHILPFGMFLDCICWTGFVQNSLLRSNATFWSWWMFCITTFHSNVLGYFTDSNLTVYVYEDSYCDCFVVKKIFLKILFMVLPSNSFYCKCKVLLLLSSS